MIPYVIKSIKSRCEMHSSILKVLSYFILLLTVFTELTVEPHCVEVEGTVDYLDLFTEAICPSWK
jgi:hypothetical protein